MYSFHLFLISPASIGSLPFLFFIVPIFGGNIPLILAIFLNRSLFFPFLLFSSVSLHSSLKKAFLSLCAILQNSAFSWVYLPFLLCFSLLFFLHLSIKPPQTTTLPSFICFSLGCFWSLPPVQYYEPLSTVLHAFCLLHLIP